MQVNASSERPLADDYLSLSAHGAQFFLQLEQDKAIKSVLQIFISTAYSITLNDLVIQLNATLESPLSFILELYDQGYFLSAKHSSKVPESSDLSSVLESFSYLSLGGKSALADANGFQLAQSGFETDQAEQLCALSAEMLSWQSRRQT
ncbi:MAG: hypothetical protein KAG18_08025, partial [Sinobacterium sp.]|nr:hypothetical protein [Sinobacterium sp.]